MNVKKTLFYLMYWIGALLFFAWYLFPSDMAAKYLANRIEAANSHIRINIETVSPAFPAALKMKGIEARLSGDIPVRADYIKASPDYVSLLRFKTGVNLSSASYGGMVTGNARITSPEAGEFSVNGRARGLSVKELSEIVSSWLPRGYTFSGTADATGHYVKEKGDEGAVQINLNGFRVKLEKPIFSIGELSFESVEAAVEFKGGRVKVTDFKWDGREFDGNLKGSVQVLSPFERSALNLNGILKPDAVFMREFGEKVPLTLLTGGKKPKKGGFNVRIGGTIGNPDFSLK